MYNLIRVVASQRSRLYGLSKMHNNNVALQLSYLRYDLYNMKCPNGWQKQPQPVPELFPAFCISDSFNVSNSIRNSEICSNNKPLVSLDIVSLYTNVLLEDTLHICTNALYTGHLCPP